MRTAFLLAALALASLAPALPVGAQDGPVALLSDSAGDIATTAAGSPAPLPKEDYAAIDLVALSAAEGLEAFTFTLTVASLAPQQVPSPADQVYEIQFRFNSLTHQLEVHRQSFAGGTDYYALLATVAPGGMGLDYIAFLEVEVDVAAATMTVDVPRLAIQDNEGSSPYPGTALEAFSVLATDQNRLPGLAPGGVVSVTDRMPDAGEGLVGLPVQFGVVQEGLVRLLSSSPTRASNGEATTYVFALDVVNLDSADQRYDLAASNIPEGWAVELPAASVRVPANESVQVPVLLTTPFSHDHGDFARFLVEARARDDATSVGRIELGIRYPAVPQPAGHHNQLFFHSEEPFQPNLPSAIQEAPLLAGFPQSYMNTLEDDGLDTGADVEAFDCGGSMTTQIDCWQVILSPTLQMGLDFDLTGRGRIAVPVQTSLPLLGAVFSGELIHVAPDASGDWGYVTLATFAADAPRDMAANSAALLEADVLPTADADFVPYRQESYLYLIVRIESTATTPGITIGGLGKPAMTPGGVLTLPLLEYHDAIDDVFEALGAVSLDVESSERFVNPGEVVVFNLTLENGGLVDDRYAITVTGANAEWATVLGDGEFGVASGSTRDVVVAIRAPAGANDGDAADLVVQAASTKDPNVKSLARVRATVDTAIDRPDEAGLLESLDRDLSAKPTPGLAPAALGLAVLALAVAWRRRD